LPSIFPDWFGRARVIVLTQPAAGADYAVTVVPNNVIWVPDALLGTLTTAVAAANRYPTLYLQDNASHPFISSVQGAIVASQVTACDWYQNATQFLPVNNSYLFGVCGIPLVAMPEGYKIYIITVNIQAADQWSAGALKVREWLNPHS
jgi:hypothetical protein